MTAELRGHTGRRTITSVWLAALAVVAVNVLAFLLFAPVLTTGFCADAPAGGTSVCGSGSVSVLQVPTSVLVWIIAAVALTALAVSVSIARHRRISGA